VSIETSTEVKDLFEALAKAQAEIRAAAKDAENPHFRNKYADLASVWDACRGPLTRNGLGIVQLPERTEGGVSVTTMLTHSSGQWIRSSLEMPLAGNATSQQVGSAITYARRYSLSAVAGVAPDDDDGNAASEGAPKEKAKPKPDKQKAKAPERSKANSETRAACARYVVECQRVGAEPRGLASFLAEALGKKEQEVEANEPKWNQLPDRVWEKAAVLIVAEHAQLGEAQHQRELKKEREPGEDEWDEDPTVGSAA
jgi:hypothetical protein